MATAQAMAFGESARTPLAPFAGWLRELQTEYPPQAVTSGHSTEIAFLAIFSGDPRPPQLTTGEIPADPADGLPDVDIVPGISFGLPP